MRPSAAGADDGSGAGGFGIMEFVASVALEGLRRRGVGKFGVMPVAVHDEPVGQQGIDG